MNDQIKTPDDTVERLASLEMGHKSLHKDLTAVAGALDNLGRDFRQAMDKLQEKIATQSATPWGVLASWASVVILILTIIGSFYVRDLARVQDEQKRIPIDIQREQALKDEIYRLKLENMQARLEARISISETSGERIR